MREIANKERTLALLQHLGQQAKGPGRIYLTGGSSAVIIGWRAETIDVDLKCDPEPLGIFEGIGKAKDELRMNIEFASPDLFIPELPGWKDRSQYIDTHGKVDFFHYDFYSQALAKLERAHQKDLNDVTAMLRENLIKVDRLLDLFEEIKPALIRFPALDPTDFESSIHQFLKNTPQ